MQAQQVLKRDASGVSWVSRRFVSGKSIEAMPGASTRISQFWCIVVAWCLEFLLLVQAMMLHPMQAQQVLRCDAIMWHVN